MYILFNFSATLHGSGWTTPFPRRFTLGKEKAGWGPKLVWTGAGNLASTGIRPLQVAIPTELSRPTPENKPIYFCVRLLKLRRVTLLRISLYSPCILPFTACCDVGKNVAVTWLLAGFCCGFQKMSWSRGKHGTCVTNHFSFRLKKKVHSDGT